MKATAVVAEDEPLLAQSFVAELAQAWPDLRVVAVAVDGVKAIEHVLALRPDIVFLDIRMPGTSGLDAAEAIAEDWPDAAGPLPLVVFVTAYDQYAVAAFERAAFDYVLKPVEPNRLATTCERLRRALDDRAAPADAPQSGRSVPPRLEVDDVLDRMRALLAAGAAPALAAEPLHVLQIGVGQGVRFVPVDDVVVFEAADKYLRVLTADAEHLIRMSLRDLLPRLDPQRFWQVHRGTVVRLDAIDFAERHESGTLTLRLRQRPDRIAVSRLHAHRFKAM